MAESLKAAQRIGVAVLGVEHNGSLELRYQSALTRYSELTGESGPYGCYRLYFMHCRDEGKEKKNTFVCSMTKLFKVILSVLMAVMPLGKGLSAQVLPVLNTFTDRTFEGAVDVSWPVLFDGCTFRTDGVVINRSYGAVFRNCTFECKGGELCIAGSGDGVILADCEVKGCESLSICREYSPAHRNYITGVIVNGDECTVLDDQTTIVDIDGLAMADCVRGESGGPLFMMMSADRKIVAEGEYVSFRVRGLEKGTFVGWRSSESSVRLTVSEDGLSCKALMTGLKENTEVLISAYTEYGLEAACEVTVRTDNLR